jgi:hypothetical protein
MSDRSKIVTVFGSSRPQEGDADYAVARELGWALASKGLVVCTGGYGGVMEAVSRGAKDAAGRTLGITAAFFEREANPWVDEEVRVESWQERLFELIQRGDCYVVCKGGTGTLVELAVVWEMLNKGVMARKPFVAMGEFWRPIVERVREIERGHPSRWAEASDNLIYVARTPAAAAEHLVRELWRLENSSAAGAEK